MKHVTLAEFASLHGASKQAATRWKSRGLLVFRGDKVDVAKSDASMRVACLGRFRIERSQAKKDRQPRGGIADQVKRVADRIIATGGVMTLPDAIALKETYLGRLRQLEFDTKVGRVVLVADVAKAVGECLARVRNRLLAMPSNIAPRLLRLTTAMAIEAEVRSAVIEALEELSTID